jgi:hypothetical protein
LPYFEVVEEVEIANDRLVNQPKAGGLRRFKKYKTSTTSTPSTF